ncbi:hypothetical protein PoB_007346500 [Plakobranchus ocellatus]|uniref:Uncharacterized protein n=1 Tax=Plakobranchus ocellatus TaxID=259542 RepID=A0AAV4DS37_9GAST|nr:hypothetical protein PoB_007346500 [Plakobranchus ocellatus]
MKPYIFFQKLLKIEDIVTYESREANAYRREIYKDLSKVLENSGHRSQVLFIEEPQRNLRELKALGLLENGLIREDLQQPEGRPPQPVRQMEIIINNQYCIAGIKDTLQGPRQCRRRPLRGSEYCRSHDPRFRTQRTAARMHRFQRLREQIRQFVQHGRQAERELLQNSRRWPVHGQRPEPFRLPEQQQDTIQELGLTFTFSEGELMMQI